MFVPLLGEIQQTGASETAGKSGNSLFYFGWWLQAVRYYDRISLSLTFTRSLNLRKISAMTWLLQHLHYTQPWSSQGEG